jgi:hypothetical protein
MSQGTRGSHIHELDLSNIPIHLEDVDHFIAALEGLSQVQ